MIERDPLLGDVLALYPSDRLRLLIPAAVVCGAAALAFGLTTAQVLDWWGPIATLLGMAAVTLAVGWWVLHGWNREVILYQRGFSYREGSRVVPLFYNEIFSIHQTGERLVYFGGLVRRTLYRVTVTTIRDEVIVLTNVYRRVGDLGDQLERLTAEVLRARVQQGIEAGETVAFGALGISAAGIHLGAGHLPWGAYSGYRVEQGRLVLAGQSGEDWEAIPLRDLHNLRLLLGLLREQAVSSGNQP
jgi:hypothetical protein